MTKNEIAKYIDHTLLNPAAGVKQVEQICTEAAKYNFASVCVNPINVGLAKNELRDTDVKICTVIGFPLGATTTTVKIAETIDSIKNGADEIDMVINIGAAKDGRFSEVGTDIAGVVRAAKTIKKDTIVKVIIETCLLDDTEIESACLCAKKAGADFVKTSTGFATPKSIDGKSLPNGANPHHVELMRKTVGNVMGIKASGGIRSSGSVVELIKAGATRIGTSNGVHIIETWDESTKI